MNIAKIEENVQKLMSNVSKKTFVYDLLLAYGQPKSAITRLKQGTYNLSKEEDEVLWKKKIYFKEVKKGDLHDLIDEAKKNESIKKQDPRFLIVTDYVTLLALDTKTNTTLDIALEKLNKHFDFFLPLGGFEKISVQIENPADVKAAEKMAKLYDQIKLDNPNLGEKKIHELNVFLSRLLFCYFAEDTEIFHKGAFTSSVASHTLPDGSDLNSYLDRLFDVLNTENRKKYPAFLQEFPYVNGGLLAVKIAAPKFSSKSRNLLLECGELNWSEINPDIFGSMIQAVVHPDARGEMGVHYTSVPNIMKVLSPIILDELGEEIIKSKGSQTRLDKLLHRIHKIKFLDPACGSGNFLIIAYKELRRLEMIILKELESLSKQQEFKFSGIKLSNFYGIEQDDFAKEVAMLSLWLAEHQMNLEFRESFGRTMASLPLKSGGNIITANATQTNWANLCRLQPNEELLVVGNPPYLGSKNQDDEHKVDKEKVFGELEGIGLVDYIACWFKLGSNLVRSNSNSRLAFVSTNSICQGEQVSILWPEVLGKDLEIFFAHQSFKWTNNAKQNAGVICVVIGIRNVCKEKKYLFTNGIRRQVDNINGYLLDADNSYVKRVNHPINGLPEIGIGNKPVDDGNYLFLKEERDRFIELEPMSEVYFRRWMGSQELLKGIERYVLLPQLIDKSALSKMPEVRKRVENVRKFRQLSKSSPTQAIADKPQNFHVECFPATSYIVIPEVSSERREYIPVGFLPREIIPSSLVRVIRSADPYIFGILSSKMHMTWVRTVAGRLKTDYRYSAEVCYNTFPVPNLNAGQKDIISNHVFNILNEREKNSEVPLGSLYDPDLMPVGLKSAHLQLDEAIDKCYRSKAFISDEDRLELLFRLYEQSIQNKET